MPAPSSLVHLVHKPTGKPSLTPWFFRSRLDMSPENMAERTAGLEAPAATDRASTG